MAARPAGFDRLKEVAFAYAFALMVSGLAGSQMDGATA